MKKQIIYFASTNLCLLFFVFLTSCSTDYTSDEPIAIQTGHSELDKYFSSSEHNEFMSRSSSKLRSEDIKTSKMHTQASERKNVNIYTIPVEKDKVLQGKLIVFSKYNGKIIRAIYEDWSSFNKDSGGNITISSVCGEEIAKLNCKKEIDSELFDISLLPKREEVLPKSESRIKTRVEMPDRDNISWIECTSQCFTMASNVCKSDPECKVMCLTIDVLGFITNVSVSCTSIFISSCGTWCMM